MKRYLDSRYQRHQYVIRETLNGFAITVLNVENGNLIPLNRSVASQMDLTLPSSFKGVHHTPEAAERELTAVAYINRELVPIEP